MRRINGKLYVFDKYGDLFVPAPGMRKGRYGDPRTRKRCSKQADRANRLRGAAAKKKRKTDSSTSIKDEPDRKTESGNSSNASNSSKEEADSDAEIEFDGDEEAILANLSSYDSSESDEDSELDTQADAQLFSPVGLPSQRQLGLHPSQFGTHDVFPAGVGVQDVVSAGYDRSLEIAYRQMQARLAFGYNPLAEAMHPYLPMNGWPSFAPSSSRRRRHHQDR